MRRRHAAPCGWGRACCGGARQSGCRQPARPHRLAEEHAGRHRLHHAHPRPAPAEADAQRLRLRHRHPLEQRRRKLPLAAEGTEQVHHEHNGVIPGPVAERGFQSGQALRAQQGLRAEPQRLWQPLRRRPHSAIDQDLRRLGQHACGRRGRRGRGRSQPGHDNRKRLLRVQRAPLLVPRRFHPVVDSAAQPRQLHARRVVHRRTHQDRSPRCHRLKREQADRCQRRRGRGLCPQLGREAPLAAAHLHAAAVHRVQPQPPDCRRQRDQDALPLSKHERYGPDC